MAIGELMAFNKSTSNQSKNQFVARLVSKKTGSTISWVNLTDEFARRVFAVAKVSEVTAEMAEDTLPMLLENDYVEVKIADLTLELEAISAKDF
jgi:hypothetical protein